MEAVVLFVVIIGGTALIAYFDRPEKMRAPRYSGLVYDGQPAPIRRAGAGRRCDFCSQTTFGLADRCGACGRLPVRLPQYPTESHLVPASSLASGVLSSSGARYVTTPTQTTPRHDPTTAPAHPTAPAGSPSLIAVAATPRPSSSRPASRSEVLGGAPARRRRSVS